VALEQGVAKVKATGNEADIDAATKALRSNRVLHFNNLLDAFVAGAFLLLVATIAVLSSREWILLLARRKLALLRESEPVWLPDYALAEAKPLHLAGLFALGFALAKELSGEAQMERAQEASTVTVTKSLTQEPSACRDHQRATREDVYLQLTEHRFKNIRRCC
jgi:uncharacterized iron-regulated membrane protein